MTRRSLRAAAVAAVLVIGGLLVPAGTAGADPASAEQAFVSSINRIRADRGLPALQVDGELTAVARRWSGRMADAGGISHNPGFSGEVTAPWRKLGENVGRGPGVDDLMRAFVDSPSHHANLVDPEFTHVGVGVVERDGELWTAHQFMVLFDQAAPAAVAPPAPEAAPASPPPAPEPSPAPVPAAVPVEAGALPVVLTSLRLLDAA